MPGTRRPYRPLWLASPFLVALAFGLGNLVLAVWLWLNAEEIDDRPTLQEES